MKKIFTLVFILVATSTFAQINFNANTTVPAYNGAFLYGSNMGYYNGGKWSDQNIAEIAAGNPSKNVAGAGVKTLRPNLPEKFLEDWGYNIRLDAFKFYNTLGIKDNTVFLQTPSIKHTDNTKFPGCNISSNVFSNLYEPIWDNGANGTPVNENNYYALYVYKTVSVYKNYVKFWEIWNEPDYDYGANGWKQSGQPGNWFDKNPAPCELPNLYAPIFYYNRMLRISYEVIKSIDPTAYVTTGGIGYPGFLDAILRNTDNPSDGSVSSTYPNKGGAFFDVLSYHDYPMYALKTNRNSDAAANEIINLKGQFQNVLSKYGYDGNTYPNKLWIITEANIPRKAVGQFLGGEDAQKNFLIKALIQCQKNSIRQFYVFSIGEGADISSNNVNNIMGLYQNLNASTPFNQVLTNGGVAYKTTSDLLLNYFYDDTKTKTLTIPGDVDGGAFQNSAGKYVYVLWAKTKNDKSEDASTSYSFPGGAKVSAQLHRREWNYSSSPSTSTVSSQSISLSGTPSFFIDDNVNPDPTPVPTPTPTPGPLGTEDDIELIKFKLYPNPSAQQFVATYELSKSEKVSIEVIDIQGKSVTKVLENSVQSPGAQAVEIKLYGVREGMYFCKFTIGSKIFTKKIIKLN